MEFEDVAAKLSELEELEEQLDEVIEKSEDQLANLKEIKKRNEEACAHKVEKGDYASAREKLSKAEQHDTAIYYAKEKLDRLKSIREWIRAWKNEENRPVLH